MSERETGRVPRGREGRGEIGASSYERAQVARSYGVERGGGGSESLSLPVFRARARERTQKRKKERV